MANILITGGAGFVGSHLVDAVVEHYGDASITVFDKLTYAGYKAHIGGHIKSGRVDLVVGDVADAEAVDAAMGGVDLVFHVAAESHVGRSFDDSLTFTRSNVLGTNVMLDAARRHRTGRFVHISTDEIYGEVTQGMLAEEENFRPNNPYAATKGAAELLVHSYLKSFGLPIVVGRGNNNFGIRQYPEKIIPTFIMAGLQAKKMTLHGDGQHRRTFLASPDFARALILIADKAADGSVYNIGAHEEYANIEIAEMVCDRLGLDPKEQIEFIADRPHNDRRYAIDSARINELGWAPQRTLAADLSGMIDWYREHGSLYDGAE